MKHIKEIYCYYIKNVSYCVHSSKMLTCKAGKISLLFFFISSCLNPYHVVYPGYPQFEFCKLSCRLSVDQQRPNK